MPSASLRSTLTLFLAAVAVTAACRPEPTSTRPAGAAEALETTNSAPEGVTSTRSGSEAPPLEGLFACSVDADCEIVEMGRCDVCNGGWQLSVRRGGADEARARHGEPTTGPAGCTKRGCDWSPTPMCDAGRCARTMDFDADPATPPTKVANFSEGRGRR